MRTCLIDTGPLVAYLRRRDPEHSRVRQHLAGYRGQLVTTSAVLTETLYFLRSLEHGPSSFSALASRSGLIRHDFSQDPELARATALMERYANVPMDYADATLLLLAEQLDVSEILTLDRRGFSVFRTPRGKALRLVLP